MQINAKGIYNSGDCTVLLFYFFKIQTNLEPSALFIILTEKNTEGGIKASYLKYKEEPSKLLSGNKFQERYFVLREGNLFLYKDMKVPVPTSRPFKIMANYALSFFPLTQENKEGLTSDREYIFCTVCLCVCKWGKQLGLWQPLC